MTTNEAAERLRAMIDGWAQRDDIRQAGWDRLDEALAAERRATMERIREQLDAASQVLHDTTDDPPGTITGQAVWQSEYDAILDEEAAR